MRLFAKDKNGHFIREVNGIKLPFPLTEFMKVRFVGYAFSAILMAISLFFIVTKGFNWGLDFTGGVVFDTHFSQPADLEKIPWHIKSKRDCKPDCTNNRFCTRRDDPLTS